MRANRIVRILIALFVLGLFVAYCLIRAAYTPMSQEIVLDGRIHNQSRQDYTRASVPASQPEETAPQQMNAVVAAGVGEAAAVEGVIEAGAAAQPEQLPAPEVPATPEPTLDPNSPYALAIANAAAKGLPTPPNVDVTSWEFTLVNGEHSIGQYEPEQLAYLNQTADETDIQYSYNGYRCPVDSRIAEPLLNFALGCKQAGLPVFLSSGYRSYSEQVANFQRVCQNNGVTDGKDANGYYITMPAGCSEHQLALCCDITAVYVPIKNASLENTETFRWLHEHCAEYGFILRFPNGKGNVTGVMYEPFHFRYVGTEAAAYIEQNNLCLEEFLALYGVM